MTKRSMHGKKAVSGTATLEMAIVLPVLLLLALPIVDIARAVQAHLILINISREGASLASRASQPYQQTLAALAATAPPLDMSKNGMIYITKIMGLQEGAGVRNIVLEQHRWARGWHQSAYAPSSTVWNCGGAGTSWIATTTDPNDGSCRGLPSPGASSPTANVMAGQLADSEVIYAVESYYRFFGLFGGINFSFGKLPVIGPNLHSMSIF